MTGESAPVPPANLSANGSGLGNLETYLGKSVEEFCGLYGKVNDGDKSHCAHFVCHVLGTRYSGAALCSNVDGTKYKYEERGTGFCIRVNQVFNNCGNRSFLAEEPAGDKCFIVATIAANIVTKDPLTIGSMSKKHIGIYTGGVIYHYSNQKSKVVKQTVKEFSNHYGKGTILLRCDLP